MFGILLGLKYLFDKTVDSVGASIDDTKKKEWWIEKNKIGEWKSGTWVDRKGVERDLVSNEIMSTRKSPVNGDKILEDIHGNVVRNFSQEERNRKYAEAKRKRNSFRTVVEWDFPNNSQYGPNIKATCYGQRYKDIKTGDLYVARRLGHRGSDQMDFYMDVVTGKYIRPTDFEMWLMHKNNNVERGMELARKILKEHLEAKKEWLSLWGKYDNAKAVSIALTDEDIDASDELFEVNF